MHVSDAVHVSDVGAVLEVSFSVLLSTVCTFLDVCFIKVSAYLCLFRVGLLPFGSICILIKTPYKSFINTITQKSQLTTQYKHKAVLPL